MQHEKTTGPIRWTLHKACSEFVINRKTLERRISEASIIAGEDNCYSTQQILSAITGDIHGERLLKTRAERESVELKNARIRRDFVSTAEVGRCMASTIILIRQEILGSMLPEDTKHSILRHLADINPPK